MNKSRKFTSLSSKKVESSIRKIIKEEGKEDIIIFNPKHYDYFVKYNNVINDFQKRYGKELEESESLNGLLVLIAGIKAFTNIEMDAESLTEYISVISNASENCEIWDELRDEVMLAIVDCKKALEYIIDNEKDNTKEFEDMDRKELLEYIKRNKFRE